MYHLRLFNFGFTVRDRISGNRSSLRCDDSQKNRFRAQVHGLADKANAISRGLGRLRGVADVHDSMGLLPCGYLTPLSNCILVCVRLSSGLLLIENDSIFSLDKVQPSCVFICYIWLDFQVTCLFSLFMFYADRLVDLLSAGVHITFLGSCLHIQWPSLLALR